MRTIPIRLSVADIERFWRLIDTSGGFDACWPWLASKKDFGHGRLKVHGTNLAAHRIAYFVEHGVDPGVLMVCHSCDNPPCCNPAHLFLGTHDDNMADMVAKGRANAEPRPGEANGRAKLRAAQVAAIRARFLAGETNVKIASDYGVTHQLISKIRRGHAWKENETMPVKWKTLRTDMENSSVC